MACQAHPGINQLKQLIRTGALKRLETLKHKSDTELEIHHCDVCAQGKQTRHSYAKQIPPTFKPQSHFDRICFDIQDPFPVETASGHIYALGGIDVATGYGWIRLLKAKEQQPQL